MINSYIRLLLVFISTTLVFACGNSVKLEKLDLMSHGLPISIGAPADAEIVVSDLGVMKDVTVKKGEDYYVQILSSKASSLDINKLKTTALAEVKAGRFFSKIIQEDDAGFIFEKKIDERINFDFRFFKIQGDSEYAFQAGLIGTFTEDQIRSMYKSVQ